MGIEFQTEGADKLEIMFTKLGSTSGNDKEMMDGVTWSMSGSKKVRWGGSDDRWGGCWEKSVLKVKV